ncbi:MAG: polyphosphate kinase 1 [Verrucomicrobiae bacterium]|nr:polyphosphate kinase 1 [Verrucomicrobiae bacterium]
MGSDFSSPELYINRELSWLEFNARVLEESLDSSQPLLERVKFLCIFSSNLDEFFEVRVAGIQQQIENHSSDVGPDGLSATEIFAAIRKRVRKLVDIQYREWNEKLRPALVENGIRFVQPPELSPKNRAWSRSFFMEEVFPVLTPLAVDPSHPFPQLLNKSQNIIVHLRKPGRAHNGGEFHAIVQIPRVLPRLIPVPPEKGDGADTDYIFLTDLILHHAGELFPGLKVLGAYMFRVTRNSDLYIDDEEAENLLRTIEKELHHRSKGNAVRLELHKGCPEEIQHFLLSNFHLREEHLYFLDGPLNLQHLMPLCTSDQFPLLKDRPFYPTRDPALPSDADIFEVLRQEDVLLHHPYESFDAIIDFLDHASRDSQVLAIKMTLYRTSGDSPIVKALINAANNGKQVTALVELKARFDEANNIQWARLLEESGVHVVYGVVGLKTHCKLLMVVRRDSDKIRRYCHLGTGNYHPRTARMYTDLSLMTSSERLCGEVAMLFNALTGLSEYPAFEKLLVAPYDLANHLKEKISRETQLALAGKPGRIIFKINSIVDEEMIKSLYQASCAGVKIDLIVRGICCLRPHIPGVSENIRVISIVGRFLEHSRIYYFGNDGSPEIYLGSADLMPRNLYRRVEVVFPVECARLKKHLYDDILETYLADCVKARELLVDGSYKRLKPGNGRKATQAQLTFRETARHQSRIISQKNKPVKGFTPVKSMKE